MKLSCKKCGCKEFVTHAVEYHNWKVDEHQNFIEDLGCYESSGPESDYDYYCSECGQVAEKEQAMIAEKVHYYNFSVGYRHKATRVHLSYGRQREGVLCLGGICRTVPASNGLMLKLKPVPQKFLGPAGSLQS